MPKQMGGYPSNACSAVKHTSMIEMSPFGRYLVYEARRSLDINGI